MLDARFEHRVVLSADDVYRLVQSSEQKEQSASVWTDALTVIA